MSGKKRKVIDNGAGGWRVNLPKSAVKALDLLNRDIIVEAVPGRGVLEWEIRIRKYVPEEPSQRDF